eukprot:s1796_g6.t3
MAARDGQAASGTGPNDLVLMELQRSLANSPKLCRTTVHGAMAGKRLVMGASPGTGLFVHEPRQSKSRYSKEPAKEEGSANKSMAEQEEEKINGRLVEILERKCAKLRSRAEQEEKSRKAMQQELEELRPQFEELQQEVTQLRAAHEKLAEDRHEALRRNGELANIQQQWTSLVDTMKIRPVVQMGSWGYPMQTPVNVCQLSAVEKAASAGNFRPGKAERRSADGSRRAFAQDEAHAVGVAANDVTYSAAKKACARTQPTSSGGLWTEACQLLRQMRTLGIEMPLSFAMAESSFDWGSFT